MVKNAPPHRDTLSLAWPIELVYEVNTRKLAGFTMPLIKSSLEIFKVYNPGLRRSNSISAAVNWRDLHRIAKNFIAALSLLHRAGHIMGDVNQKNVLVANDSLVTLVDTDSFQIRDSMGEIYRAPVATPDYTPPELQDPKARSMIRTVSHDCFGMTVLIFQILMEGFHPFAGAPKNLKQSMLAATPSEQIKVGVFPYQLNGSLNPPPAAPSFQALHPDVQKLFIRCFVDGHKNSLSRPTTLDWINALEKAEKDLVQCEQDKSHWYSKQLGKCHWCRSSPLYAVNFPVPIPPLPVPTSPAIVNSTVLQPSRTPQLTTLNLTPVLKIAAVLGSLAIIAWWFSSTKQGAEALKVLKCIIKSYSSQHGFTMLQVGFITGLIPGIGELCCLVALILVVLFVLFVVLWILGYPMLEGNAASCNNGVFLPTFLFMFIGCALRLHLWGLVVNRE